MNISLIIIRALNMKNTKGMGTSRAAGYLRNQGFSVEQAVSILARPVRIVVPC